MPGLRRLLALAALALAGCERAPDPGANVALEPPAPAAPERVPEPVGAAPEVGRDEVGLEATMIPELDGVRPLAGRWSAGEGRARFVSPAGVALSVACEGGDIVIAYRPERAPAAGERDLKLLTARGTNLFAAAPSPAEPRVLVARFTARLPFFTDALGAGEGVIGVLLGARAAVAVPNDPAVGDVVRGCR